MVFAEQVNLASRFKIESCFRRAWRVIEDIHRFKNQPVNGKRVSYLDVVRNLDEAYSWSANLRRSRTQGIEYAEFIRRNDQYNDTDRIRCLDHIESLEKTAHFDYYAGLQCPDFFLKSD